MTEPTDRCPKCDGTMQQGFTISSDRRSALSSFRWISGTHRTSFWTNVVIPSGATVLPVGTFRCSSCGYLEAYARSEFAAQ